MRCHRMIVSESGCASLHQVKSLSVLFVLALAVPPACSVYGEGMFDDTNASVGGTSGGTANGGGPVDGGSGGTPSGGGSGTGGDGLGGEPVGGTGGDGSGGAVGTYVLIDDLEQGPTYTNAPFTGGWDRYIDGSGNGSNWDQDLVDMVEVDPDDSSNQAFRVHVTGFSAGSWGLGVYVSLNAPSTITAIDISGYTKLIVRARGSSSAARTLRIAIEDDPSRTAPACPNAACVPHAPLGQRTLTVDEWQTIELSLAATRVPAFDPTKAYAIHFTMDPRDSTSVVDFWIDDIYFVE